MIEISIKQMYGLNDKTDFIFKSTNKHNFIYGINASGKSSIASAINHFVSLQPYNKKFPYDSDEFYTKVSFNEKEGELSKENNTIGSIPDLSNNVFVFNKEFIKNSLSMSDQSGSKPEIGIQITEKNKAISDNSTMINKNVKAMISTIKEKGLPVSSKEFFKDSKMQNLNARSEEKKFDFLNNMHKVKITSEIILNELHVSDFHQNNIKLFQEFHLFLTGLKKDIVKEITEQKNNSKYKIRNTNDKNFYSEVLNYLNNQTEIDNCPICLNEEINIKLIILEIKRALNVIVNNETLKKISEMLLGLTSEYSFFRKKIEYIYDSLVEGKYPNEEIISYEKDIVKFLNNYDENYVHFAEIDFPDDLILNINNNIKLINSIELKNKELQKDNFIVELDNMLKLVFKNDFIRAKSKLNNGSIILQLEIEGKEKENKSVEELFDEILSESQKTKLSLAFFISLVTYKNEKRKVLCIFDDPVDSYDSISKYHISRIIYEFIHKKVRFEKYKYECYDIIFSHSIEYFRLFYNNFRKSDRVLNKYFVLSAGVSEIKINDLFLINGDFKILEELLFNRASNGEKVNIIEILAIMPILRELSKYASKNLTDSLGNQLEINSNALFDLNTFISNKILHGFSEAISLGSLVDVLNKYINVNIDFMGYSNSSLIKDVMRSYIINATTNDLYSEMILKNIIAIYIRNYYDDKLSDVLLNENFNFKSIGEIKENNNLWTLNNKISKIYKAGDTVWGKYKHLCSEISTVLVMLNDYSHSAGIFLTPLIDVPKETLIDYFQEIERKER